MSNKFNFLNEQEQAFLDSGEWMNEYPRLKNALNTPRFKISDLGITARDATYWDKQGILPKLHSKGVRKYDLSQAVWIRLITQMRTLGISLEIIRHLHDNLFAGNLISVKDTIEGSPEVFAALKTMLEQKGELESFEKLLKDAEFIKEMANEYLNIFELCIMTVIMFKKQISLIVDSNGGFFPYSPELERTRPDLMDDMRDVFDRPHIILSITLAYSQLLDRWELEPFIEQSNLLSENELKILEELKQPGLKSVKVNFKDGEMDLLEIVKNEKVSLTSRFMDLIGKNSYQTVTIKSKKGNVVHYENIVLKKMNSIR